MQYFIILFWLVVSVSAQADGRTDLIRSVVDQHILPGVAHLTVSSADLANAAQNSCDPHDPALRRAYGGAFDAWIAVSHLSFGPFETDNRGFALAFWPDTRSKTPKALSTLIRNVDPVAFDPVAYRDVSVAARGFYALEFLMYDSGFSGAAPESYRCQLLRMITADLSATSAAILTDWQQLYRPLMLSAGAADNRSYQTADEAVQELFKALMTGLQFTTQARLGRPMGTFERPRARRAEARRSGRSLRHVQLSIAALDDLADLLAKQTPILAKTLSKRFQRAANLARDLDDPVFANVALPQGRIRVEVLQQSIEIIALLCREELGPALGVVTGFNAMDGD